MDDYEIRRDVKRLNVYLNKLKRACLKGEVEPEKVFDILRLLQVHTDDCQYWELWIMSEWLRDSSLVLGWVRKGAELPPGWETPKKRFYTIKYAAARNCVLEKIRAYDAGVPLDDLLV